MNAGLAMSIISHKLILLTTWHAQRNIWQGILRQQFVFTLSTGEQCSNSNKPTVSEGLPIWVII